MKRKKIITFFCLLVTIGMLITSSANAVKIETEEKNKTIVKTSDQDFGVIGSLTIDGSAEDMCNVEMDETEFVINDYVAGDKVKFSADYEIIKDVKGPWVEPPYGEGPDNHPTTIEKWDFKIKAIVNGYEYKTIDEVKTIKDCPWEVPPEILLVQAPSSVVEGEEFHVLVTFQGEPTSHYWGLPEEVTFNDETKNADENTGIVTFMAPEVNEDTEFTIDAVKDWDNADDHHPGEENVLTYGETKITVLNQPDALDLVVISPSSVMEREEFQVLVKADGNPLPGVAVFFDGSPIPHITGLDGKTTIEAPEVNDDEEYSIYANFAGFFDGETKITVHADYDDESDETDESGTTGTFSLEFDLSRYDFYRGIPSPNGYQTPIEIEIILRCNLYRWGYKGYPHWQEDDTDWNRGYLEMTLENSKPSLVIDGPTNGKVGTSYSYTATATDPDGDPIHYYHFFWDENDITDNTFDNNDFHGFDSGEPCSHSHTWNQNYEGNIIVVAEDAIGDASVVSLPISMPKSKFTSNHPILARLFELFPVLQRLQELPILEKILGKII